MENVERMTLPNGGWWDIHTVITRGMRKQINQASLKTIGNSGFTLSDAETMKSQMMAHPEGLNLSAMDDAMLLAGTVAYSYGAVVSIEIIDSLPDTVVATVLAKLNDLYRGVTPAEADDFFVKR